MEEFNVNKLVFSSSCAVYGNPKGLLTEEHPNKPISVYGETKLQSEKLLQEWMEKGKLKYIALRYFNASGSDPMNKIGESHKPETHLIPSAIKAILSNDKIQIFGNDYETKDGTCIRDYIHVCDIARAHELAAVELCNNNFTGHINLGSGSGFSVLEIIKEISKTTGKTPNIQIKERRAGDPAILIASNQLSRSILNWQPEKSSIHQIIDDALSWEKTQRRA